VGAEPFRIADENPKCKGSLFQKFAMLAGVESVCDSDVTDIPERSTSIEICQADSCDRQRKEFCRRYSRIKSRHYSEGHDDPVLPTEDFSSAQ
jgi:hypothetical protein